MAQLPADKLFAWMIDNKATASRAADALHLSPRRVRALVRSELALPGSGRLAGWTPPPALVDWPALFAWMLANRASRRAAAKQFNAPPQTVMRRVRAELAKPNHGLLNGWAVERKVIDWDRVFAWMVATGGGQSAAARKFALKLGTVLRAVHQERRKPAGGRLGGWAPAVRP